MVKHKGRRGGRKMGRYLKGAIEESVSFGGLGSRASNADNFDSVVNERTLVTSIVATYTVSNITPATNVGPVLVWVAHGDYSTAEVDAFLTQTGSWNETDLVSQEVAKRKIRRIGIIKQPEALADSGRMNDGKPVKTKLNWILTQGQTLQYGVFNTGSVGYSVTTPTMRAQGHANLWPK